VKDYAEGVAKMSSRSFGSLLVLLPLALAAQSLRERIAVPLNNWPAPHRLQRSQLQAQQHVVTPNLSVQPQISIQFPPPPGIITPDSLVFVPVVPCRVADTRPGSGYPALGSTPLASLTPRTLPIAGTCAIPTLQFGIGPEGYSLNVTVVPPSGTPAGYLVVYPNPATPIPLVASETWNPGASYQTNAVITAASSDGSVNVAVRFPTDVVVDINGYYAAPTDSGDDTALGAGTLASDTSGFYDTAFGYQALYNNVSGKYNTAIGGGALYTNVGSSYNTAIGALALQYATGSGNVGIGDVGGAQLAAGNYNIMIGNMGSSSDDNTIRIGDNQSQTYIAGISGNTVSGGAPVVVNSQGQLGVESVSSRRYKEEIHEMGDASNGLLRLRPVTFHYKKPDTNGSKPLEYGLIAEEVADVYPDLVVRGQDGQIESVQYQKLPAMLLNELQKEHRNAEEQAQQQARHAQQQDETIKKLEARLVVLEAQLTNATAKVTSDKALPSAAGGR
jgi:hypothetical protein